MDSRSKVFESSNRKQLKRKMKSESTVAVLHTHPMSSSAVPELQVRKIDVILAVSSAYREGVTISSFLKFTIIDTHHPYFRLLHNLMVWSITSRIPKTFYELLVFLVAVTFL